MPQYIITTEGGKSIGRVEIFEHSVPDSGWELGPITNGGGKIRGFVLSPTHISEEFDVIVEEPYIGDPTEEVDMISIWDRDLDGP